MEPVLLRRQAKLLRVQVFELTLLLLHLVSLKAGESEPQSAEPRDCLDSSSISVQEGGSIRISVPFESVDLYIWNSSASEWENACHFSDDSGVCKPLLKNFKEHTTLAGKNLMLHNVSREATGIYKVLLMRSGECVAWRNVTVEEGAEPRDCLYSSSISVQEGGSIHIAVPSEHDKEPVDLYIWRSSASRWEHTFHRYDDSGICRPLRKYCKERTTLAGENLTLHNVSREATGIYKVLLMRSGKCVAWRNVTVEEGSGHANHGGSLTYFTFGPILVLLVVLCNW